MEKLMVVRAPAASPSAPARSPPAGGAVHPHGTPLPPSWAPHCGRAGETLFTARKCLLPGAPGPAPAPGFNTGCSWSQCLFISGFGRFPSKLKSTRQCFLQYKEIIFRPKRNLLAVPPRMQKPLQAAFRGAFGFTSDTTGPPARSPSAAGETPREPALQQNMTTDVTQVEWAAWDHTGHPWSLEGFVA